MDRLVKDGSIFLGLNYWSSRDAIKMWENWDADVVEKDFACMREFGVTHLRVFPLWSVFQPIHALRTNFTTREYAFANGPLPDTEAGRAGVSEEACEHFAVLCDLAVKHGLKLIVGLITGHMSFRYFAPPALEGKNPITDPTALKWELRFVRYFVKRFAGHEAIAGWDLGNECNGFGKEIPEEQADAAYVWCSAVSNAIRTSDPVHPVITGFDIVPTEREAFNILDIAETADIHTVHTYNIFRTKNDPLVSMRPILDGSCLCNIYRDLGKRPCFLQEVGSIGYTNCSERSEAMFYRALALSLWTYGCHGVMWWCAFDQGGMDYPPYDWNTIGSDYGFFRADRTPKPVATENKKLAEWMARLPFKTLPPVRADAVCVLPKDDTKPFALMNTTRCLALQANMNVTFVHATQKMPKADLYLLPSIDQRHSIPKRRLEEILSNVREGASLYLSLGKGLFRQLPELTGVEIFCRHESGETETVTLGEETLRVRPDFRYEIESCNAEVLATGEDGRPVYVKHAYGKGFVYFSTVPIEKHLMGQNKVFSTEDCPNYSAWYRPLAEQVADNHAMDLRSQMVRVTEHAVDEDHKWAVILNYSAKRADAEIVLQSDWSIAEVAFGECADGWVHVDACDGVVLRLERRRT